MIRYLKKIQKLLFKNSFEKKFLNNQENDFSKKFVSKNNKKIILFQSSIDYGGFDSFLSKKILENSIKIKKFKSISINEIPKCGQNHEILNYYNLSAGSILDIIKKF